MQLKKKKTSKSEVYNDASLPQETRKISNKQSKLSSKKIQEREQAIGKVRRSKEII